jgi:quercetin dioxygenase-like cupin family protein
MKPLQTLLVAAGAFATISIPTAARSQMAGANASGYYIHPLAERSVSQLPRAPLYWRIETFAALAAAEAAAKANNHALATSVSGHHWLFTLGPKGGSTPGGSRVAEIGPIAVPRASRYLLRINHAGGPPGSETPVHTHPGAEAILVLKGEITQRTSAATNVGRAGQTLNAHSPGMVRQIRSTGRGDLEQLVMFVVDADRPFSPPAKF